VTFFAASRLWFLVPVGVLAAVYVGVQRGRRRSAVRFSNVDLLATVVPWRPGWRRHLPAVASILALALLILAFARPARAVSVPQETATVVLAIDVSESMRATDVPPSRLQAAQRAALSFIDSLPQGLRLGLVTFGGTAQVLVLPTHQRAPVKQAVTHLQPEPSTAIGEAIFASLQAINGAPTAKTKRAPARIVLLSDGATNAGRPNDEAAAAARKKGVPVSTIAFGTDHGTVAVQDQTDSAPVDQDALRKIANETGGRFATAASEADLRDTYRQIGSSLAHVTRARELTLWFVGIALVFAFAAAVGSLVWASRLP